MIPLSELVVPDRHAYHGPNFQDFLSIELFAEKKTQNVFQNLEFFIKFHFFVVEDSER